MLYQNATGPRVRGTMGAYFVLSGPVRRMLDDGWTRTAVLTVAGASALLLIARSLI